MDSIRTQPYWKLVIFALVGLILSVGVIIIFVFTDDSLAFKITMWCFCGIFAVIAMILLYSQLFFWVEIKGDKFIRRRFLIKKTINISEISKVTMKNGFYDVYRDGKRFASINSDDKASQRMLLYLEKKGVNIHWK